MKFNKKKQVEEPVVEIKDGKKIVNKKKLELPQINSRDEVIDEPKNYNPNNNKLYIGLIVIGILGIGMLITVISCAMTSYSDYQMYVLEEQYIENGALYMTVKDVNIKYNPNPEIIYWDIADETTTLYFAEDNELYDFKEDDILIVKWSGNILMKNHISDVYSFNEWYSGVI